MPRPVTPVYSELSEILQISLHRALTRQQEPAGAAGRGGRNAGAAGQGEARSARRHDGPLESPIDPPSPWRRRGWVGCWRSRHSRSSRSCRVFPILWTFWESLHLARSAHAVARPAIHRRGNYVELMTDRRFWSAFGHTAFFAGTSVALELAAGLALALALERVVRGRCARAHGRPAAVGDSHCRRGAGLAFHVRESGGLASELVGSHSGVACPDLVCRCRAAWIPLVLADVWKTTPFVALLLLAGLQNIDRSLYEAADVDGAAPWRQFAESPCRC